MYCLQNNVEIISGAKKSCIYDLNARKLYSLDSEAVEILYSILANDKQTPEVLLTEVGQYLLEAGIVVDNGNLVPILDIPASRFDISFAWIEITQNCNLICRHCYEGSSRRTVMPEMSFDNFTFIIDELIKCGVDGIQLVGGEPLIHSQICQMIDYVSGKFSYIEVYTNGTLLTDSILDQIARNGITIALSYYSEDPKLHDRVTCTKGSFNLTHRNIQKALNKGISVRLASVEMKDVPKFQLTSFEVPFRTDLPRLTGRANLSLYNREMLRRKLITKATFARPIDAETFYKNKVLHNCFGERLYIDCMLNLYPCAMERRISYGNALGSSLDDLLHDNIASLTKDKIQGCKDCEYRYACYDCRCDANGAPIDAKPWYCTYDQANGVWVDPEVFIDLLLKNHRVLPSE